MLVNRPFWQQLIKDAWSDRSIIWLMGVRRIGKTSLAQSMPDIKYFDCELPRTRQLLVDPEEFLEAHRNQFLILDEIHRLENPSEILKIAADHYPDIKIIATGSSTLGASKKFKDTLTGRKYEIWLTPLLLEEMELFEKNNLRHRLLFGGFPAFFLSKQLPEKWFQEWIDGYWAKDIKDFFSVEKGSSFQKFVELLLANSGGLFEATRYTVACEISRPTIVSYLAVLEETFVVHIIRPFSTHRSTEIVLAPKVYGLDTGFICYAKGWKELRQEDLGTLWEHCVLNEIQGYLQTRNINYWRNKSGNEIDFIMRNKNDKAITAIECKLSILENKSMDSIIKNFTAFRHHYPDGENYVVASNVEIAFKRTFENLTVHFVNTKQLAEKLK